MTHDAAPFGRPRADELLLAVNEFLRERFLESEDAGQQHDVRVIIHVLAQVARELEAGPDALVTYNARLAQLGVSSEEELVDGIRSGAFDDNGSLRAILLAETIARLRVTNPSWLAESERV